MTKWCPSLDSSKKRTTHPTHPTRELRRHRALRTFWCGAVAIVAVACLASCSRVEQGVLDRFFEASRLRDRTVLRSIATVAFEPHEQGIIRTFTIVSVSEAE